MTWLYLVYSQGPLDSGKDVNFCRGVRFQDGMYYPTLTRLLIANNNLLIHVNQVYFFIDAVISVTSHVVVAVVVYFFNIPNHLDMSLLSSQPNIIFILYIFAHIVSNLTGSSNSQSNWLRCLPHIDGDRQCGVCMRSQ